MDQLALIEDMRRATASIVAARLPIRLRASHDGVVVETPGGPPTTRTGPMETVATWATLDAASAPVIEPLVRRLIAYLRQGGPVPQGFTAKTVSPMASKARH